MLWHDPAHPARNLAAAPAAHIHCPKGQAGRQRSIQTLGKPQVLGNMSKTHERGESRNISQARNMGRASRLAGPCFPVFCASAELFRRPTLQLELCATVGERHSQVGLNHSQVGCCTQSPLIRGNGLCQPALQTGKQAGRRAGGQVDDLLVSNK